MEKRTCMKISLDVSWVFLDVGIGHTSALNTREDGNVWRVRRRANNNSTKKRIKNGKLPRHSSRLDLVFVVFEGRECYFNVQINIKKYINRLAEPDRSGPKMCNYRGTSQPRCMFLSFSRDNFVNTLCKKTKQCRPTEPNWTERIEPNQKDSKIEHNSNRE